MKFTDVRGLELTTTSAQAVEKFNASIASNAEYRLNAGDLMAEAIEADPNFTMAHCVMGYYLKSAEAFAPPEASMECLLAAEATDLSKVTEREQKSVKALRAWIENRQDDAIAIWDEILDDHPTDLLTLQLNHYRNFWHGKAIAIKDSVARAFYAWDKSMPNYSNVLGMYSFGYNETGDKVRGLELGLEAVALNPDDLWAVHAVSHVYHDTGDKAKGIALLAGDKPEWDDRNAIREHLRWHESILHWDLGDYDAVLDLYDNHVAKAITPFYLDIQNTAAVLWRLECAGVDVGNRWQDLSDVVAQRVVTRNLPFTDVHLAMVLGRTGEQQRMNDLIKSIRSDSGKARNAHEMSSAETDLAVCEAVDAYCQGDYATTISKLLPGRWNAYRSIGASDAQRDVISVMLGQAALKAGENALARSVFAQRVEAKPSSQLSWLWYANALKQCGDADAAQKARAQMLKLDGKLAA